ncbi:hypothetical protein F5X99DRAFT_364473 [Biscogniauxia marginata]|nr:hypothetical protein F5X99DRAFT_364473 [Biscogniauxia marginata]
MAFSCSDTKTIQCGWQERWGTKFKWTPEHLTPKDLESLIYTYDTVATEALGRLDKIAPPLYTVTSHQPQAESIEGAIKPDGEKKAHRDLYGLVRKHATTDENIGRLWAEINTVPDWVEWDRIERGQKVFYRYGGPTITALTFVSLLGGMGSGRTVETLDRTGGFGVNVVRRRLLETTQHILNATRDLESIKPGGDGFVNSVQVRLLHAAVRRRIMQMSEHRPDYYDVGKYGVPINDLDSLGTINTFSAAVIWLGLPRQGIWLRNQEIADYLALWRYIAYLVGAPHDWMSTPESAKCMMGSLLVSEIRPTRASATLANNIIAGLQGQAPTYASREYMCAETYWLNGRELSEALGIERPRLYYSALVLGQCILYMAICYVNRSVRYLDERNIDLVRKAFFKFLLHDKSVGALGYTTNFSFKYVPRFDRMSTERGLAPADSGIRKAGIERAALVSLLASAAAIGITAWYGAKAADALARWSGLV